MKQKLRVIFFGTPAFAVPTLRALVSDDYFEVVGVITNPDRPAGRGMKMCAPPVKDIATELGLPVIQPGSLSREDLALLGSPLPDADVGVTAACGFFIPRHIREAYRLGVVNLHPSLLPDLRGAAPLNWAIINGYETTGISIFKLVKEMDAGPILSQTEYQIEPDETVGDLHDRLSVEGADVMLSTLKQYASGEIEPIDQSENGITYAPKISSDICTVKWTDARTAFNLYRGLTPYPGACFFFGDERVRICNMDLLSDEATRSVPGTIISVDCESIVIACGIGEVRLNRLRPAGKNDMDAGAFARGRDLTIGKNIQG